MGGRATHPGFGATTSSLRQANRSRGRRSPGCRLPRRLPPCSNLRDPAPQRFAGKVFFEAGANAGIAREVVIAEPGKGFVPDLRGDLVVKQVALEVLLVPGAVEDQPARPGIAEPVRE